MPPNKNTVFEEGKKMYGRQKFLEKLNIQAISFQDFLGFVDITFFCLKNSIETSKKFLFWEKRYFKERKFW